MRALVLKLLKDEAGGTAIEYALIAGLIAMGIIGGVTALGTNLRNVYNNVGNSFN